MDSVTQRTFHSSARIFSFSIRLPICPLQSHEAKQVRASSSTSSSKRQKVSPLRCQKWIRSSFKNLIKKNFATTTLGKLARLKKLKPKVQSIFKSSSPRGRVKVPPEQVLANSCHPKPAPEPKELINLPQ